MSVKILESVLRINHDVKEARNTDVLTLSTRCVCDKILTLTRKDKKEDFSGGCPCGAIWERFDKL